MCISLYTKMTGVSLKMLLIGSNGRHTQREPGTVHFPLFPTTYF